MRYLHNRNEFLIQKNILSSSKDFNVTEEIKTSALVNETFENDITWGGSMLGRLINSTLRRFKIGYSQVKVEPLVKKLEDELNYLLSASLQGDTLAQYNQLRIKSYIEEIRDICLSNRTDPEKLERLLGQSTDLYDPNNPKRNQRTIGIVQEALDVITDDLKDLKKLFGEERDKLIDKLSDFSDDLRKLTVPQGTRVQPTQQGAVNNFNLNFLNTLDKLKNSGLVNASYNFDTKFLTSYQLFTETRLLENEEQGKEISKNVPSGQKETTEIDKEKYNQSLDSWKKSQQAAGKNTKPGQGTRNRLEREAGLSQKTGGTPQTTDQSTDTSKITKSEIDSVYNLVNGKKEEDQKDNPEVKKLLNDIDANIPKEKLSRIKVKYDGKDITLSDAIQKLKAETVKESRYIILENAFVPGGAGPQPLGPSGGGGGTVSTPQSVEDMWKIYDFDANRSATRLTQREVDELNSLIGNGTQNMRYEPEKRPDPIVSIARIFGEAHQLYFTDVIPSGRPNGRVSQKTFREYYKLGKEAAKWEDGVAPAGPFAVKSVFNKWKTGVEKLLMNQEYRKILSNVKFVVPGAEDKFNDNFNTKVFEAEGDTPTTPTTTKQSDGQILFEFMNNMLDKNKIDDFDALRSSLMAKYFGIKMKEEDRTPKSASPNQQPAKDDFQPNITYFTGLQNPKISVKGPYFYAIPVVKFTGKSDGKTHDTIFMQVIKKITVVNPDDAILIRFTYDDPIIMKNYHKLKLGSSQYIDWSLVKVATIKLFYGLMKSNQVDIKDNKEFTLVYGNVNNGEVNGISSRPYKVKSGKRVLQSGEEINMTPSKLVFNDASKVNEIKLSNGFESKVMQNDKATHDQNLNKNVKGINKTLIEALKEKFKNP